MAISQSTSMVKASKKPSGTRIVSAEERRSMIAEAAYYLAERRDFKGEDSASDWLAAEAEIDNKLAKRD